MPWGCSRMKLVEGGRLGVQKFPEPTDLSVCQHDTRTEQWAGKRAGPTVTAAKTMALQTFTAH